MTPVCARQPRIPCAFASRDAFFFLLPPRERGSAPILLLFLPPSQRYVSARRCRANVTMLIHVTDAPAILSAQFCRMLWRVQTLRCRQKMPYVCRSFSDTLYTMLPEPPSAARRLLRRGAEVIAAKTPYICSPDIGASYISEGEEDCSRCQQYVSNSAKSSLITARTNIQRRRHKMQLFRQRNRKILFTMFCARRKRDRPHAIRNPLRFFTNAAKIDRRDDLLQHRRRHARHAIRAAPRCLCRGKTIHRLNPAAASF